MPTDEVSKRRDSNKQLLDQYSSAVCLRQAHDMDAAFNASLARIGMESDSFAAARVIAGLSDPTAVQDTIDRLNAAARARRQAFTPGAQLVLAAVLMRHWELLNPSCYRGGRAHKPPCDTNDFLCACRVAAADADTIIKDKFVPALDASIVRLQNVMEGLCHDLNKSEGKRDAKAGQWQQGLGTLTGPRTLGPITLALPYAACATSCRLC